MPEKSLTLVLQNKWRCRGPVCRRMGSNRCLAVTLSHRYELLGDLNIDQNQSVSLARGIIFSRFFGVCRCCNVARLQKMKFLQSVLGAVLVVQLHIQLLFHTHLRTGLMRRSRAHSAWCVKLSQPQSHNGQVTTCRSTSTGTRACAYTAVAAVSRPCGTRFG